MGIALLALGALVSLGGWGVLLTGFGLESNAASGAGLPYLPSSPTISGERIAIVEQAIMLGYFLMTLGAIALGTSSIKRLIEDVERDLPMAPLAHADPEPAPVPVSSGSSGRESFLSKARVDEPPVDPVDEAHDDEADETAGFAQIVQEGEIEGRHFIEYDNGIVDVQTAAGWRRFDSLEQAVEQLRREG